MNKELLFDAVGEIDDGILDRYHRMDIRLARKHARKKNVIRVLAVAACLAILMSACVPVGMLIASIEKEPPVINPGEIIWPEQSSDEQDTTIYEDTTNAEDGTAPVEPDTTTDSGEDATEPPDVPQPPESIDLRSAAELAEMREMILCQDEQELQQYLSSVMGGGAQSRQDLIDFVNLVDTTPFVHLLQGEITWLNYSKGVSVDTGEPYEAFYVTVEADNGEWVRCTYSWTKQDTAARLTAVLDALGGDMGMDGPVLTDDHRMLLLAQQREPHPSGTGDTVTWWGEVDGNFVEICYYVDSQKEVKASELFGSLEVTGIIEQIIQPPIEEPKYAWENTQFGAFLEQPEYHAYLTYDATPSPQLDPFVKDIDVEGENYIDANAPKERTLTLHDVEYALTYSYSTTQDLVLQATHYYTGKTADGRKYQARFDQETGECVMFKIEGGLVDASIYEDLYTAETEYLKTLVSDLDQYDSGVHVSYQGEDWYGYTRRINGYESCDAVYVLYDSDNRVIEGFLLTYTGSLRLLDSLGGIPEYLKQSMLDTLDGMEETSSYAYRQFNGFVITQDGRLAMDCQVQVMNDLPGYANPVFDSASLLIYFTEPIK